MASRFRMATPPRVTLITAQLVRLRKETRDFLPITFQGGECCDLEMP